MTRTMLVTFLSALFTLALAVPAVAQLPTDQLPLPTDSPSPTPTDESPPPTDGDDGTTPGGVDETPAGGVDTGVGDNAPRVGVWYVVLLAVVLLAAFVTDLRRRRALAHRDAGDGPGA